MEFPIVASHHRLHCSSQYHLGVDRARERERWRTFSPLLDELLERRRRHVAEAIEQGLLALSQVRRLDERILGRLARELGVKVSHVLDALLFCGGMGERIRTATAASVIITVTYQVGLELRLVSFVIQALPINGLEERMCFDLFCISRSAAKTQARVSLQELFVASVRMC